MAFSNRFFMIFFFYNDDDVMNVRIYLEKMSDIVLSEAMQKKKISHHDFIVLNKNPLCGICVNHQWTSKLNTLNAAESYVTDCCSTSVQYHAYQLPELSLSVARYFLGNVLNRLITSSLPFLAKISLVFCFVRMASEKSTKKLIKTCLKIEKKKHFNVNRFATYFC